MIIARITPGWGGALRRVYGSAGEHLALTRSDFVRSPILPV
jgi:hypothetical protein